MLREDVYHLFVYTLAQTTSTIGNYCLVEFKKNAYYLDKKDLKNAL